MRHTIRTPEGTQLVELGSPRVAIKAFCQECLGWEGDPKADCTSPLCPLFPLRGKSGKHYLSAAIGDSTANALPREGGIAQ